MDEDNRLRKLIAPSVDDRVKVRTAINDYAYYVVIVIVSMIVMFVPPLLIGSLHGDVGLFFPTTVAGWVLWGVINASTAIGNVAILVLFKLQAKKNCRGNENFRKANEILMNVNKKTVIFIPRSPRQMNVGEYMTKAIFIVIGSLVSFMAVTSIIISFDVVTLISTVISVLTSLCVSWTTMVKNEEYWCHEYLLYAEMVQKKLQGGEIDGKREDLPSEHAAAGGEEHPRDPSA